MGKRRQRILMTILAGILAIILLAVTNILPSQLLTYTPLLTVIALLNLTGLILDFFPLCYPEKEVDSLQSYTIEEVLEKDNPSGKQPDFFRERPLWVDFEQDRVFPHPQIPRIIRILESSKSTRNVFPHTRHRIQSFLPFQLFRTLCKTFQKTTLFPKFVRLKRQRRRIAPFLQLIGLSSAGKTNLLIELGYTIVRGQRRHFTIGRRKVYFISIKDFKQDDTIRSSGFEPIIQLLRSQNYRATYLLIDDVHWNPKLANQIIQQIANTRAAVVFTSCPNFEKHNPAEVTRFLQSPHLERFFINTDINMLKRLARWFLTQRAFALEDEIQLDEVINECGFDWWLLCQLLLRWVKHPENPPTVRVLYKNIVNHIRLNYASSQWVVLLSVCGLYQFNWPVPQDFLVSKMGLNIDATVIEKLKRQGDLYTALRDEVRTDEVVHSDIQLLHTRKAYHWFRAGVQDAMLCLGLQDIIRDNLENAVTGNLCLDLVQTYLRYCTRSLTEAQCDKATLLLVQIAQVDAELCQNILQRCEKEVTKLQQCCSSLGLLRWSEIYAQTGHYKDAIAICYATLRLRKELPQAYSLRATLFEKLGSYQQAKEDFEYAITLYSQQCDIQGIAITLSDLSRVLAQLGELKEALQKLNRAHTLVLEVGDKLGIAKALDNMGLVLRQMGQREKAKAKHERALKLYREQNHRLGVADTLGNMGQVLRQLGHLKEALTKHQEAYDIYEELGNKVGMANQLNGIGRVLMHQGFLEKALVTHKRALRIHKSLKHKLGLATTHGEIGLVQEQLTKHKEALSHFRKALHLHQELEHKLGIAGDLGGIGLIRGQTEELEEELEEAMQEHEEAYKILVELGNEPSMANQLNGMGLILHRQGELQKSLVKFREALKLHQKRNHRLGVAASFGNIGLVLKDIGELEEAIKHLEKALQLYEEAGARRYAVTVLEKLAELTLSKEEYDTSQVQLLRKQIRCHLRVLKDSELDNALKPLLDRLSSDE